MQSILEIVDNSKSKRVRVIKVFRGMKATLGTVVLASVIQMGSSTTQVRTKVHKGQVVRVLVLRQAPWHRRADGSFLRFQRHQGILLDARNRPLGTRFFGPAPAEIRLNAQLKSFSFATRCL